MGAEFSDRDRRSWQRTRVGIIDLALIVVTFTATCIILRLTAPESSVG
jgi:hypothetical protein